MESPGPDLVQQPLLEATDGNYVIRPKCPETNDSLTFLRERNSSIGTGRWPRSVPGQPERLRILRNAEPDFSFGGGAEIKTPFDLYCAEIRRLKKLNPDDERRVQVRMTEVAEILLRTISRIPATARYFLQERRSNGLPSNLRAAVRDTEFAARSVTVEKPFDDDALLDPDENEELADRLAGADFTERSSGFPVIQRLVALMDNLHDAVRQHGIAHEITRSRRADLSEAIGKLPLTPSYLKSLVGHLQRELNSQKQYQKSKDGAELAPGSTAERFEDHHAIHFDEFEQILGEASRLYFEWEKIRNRIAEFHVGLVVYLARQYSSEPQELVDLIQEGNIGLLKAVERYDYRLGFRFSTYATYWIRLAMSRYIARSSRAVRLPYRQNLNIGSVRKKRESFRQIHGHFPTTIELARETGISAAGLVKLETLSQVIASLDAQLEPGENLDLLSMLEQQTFREPVETVEKQSMNGLIESAIDGLNQREAYVIRQRFGIGVYAERTLQELGAVLGLTRERVRQIENGAIKKIRRLLEPLAV